MNFLFSKRGLQRLFLLASLVLGLPVFAGGRLERFTVASKAVSGNLLGDDPNRPVTVYLPPSYDSSGEKRFPVLYLLHGIGDTDRTWTGDTEPWHSIQDVLDRGIAQGVLREMLVVMSDQRTRFFGSFYTNSPVSGNYEDFTVEELVSYIDGHYRTLAQVESRGIAGHSMGGYGALALGMKHPQVFGAVYALSPAVLGWMGDLSPANPTFVKVPGLKSFEEMVQGMRETGDLYLGGIVTVAQAFSPNPDRPPFYADFPFTGEPGALVPQEPAFSQWEAHFIINMAHTHADKLRTLRALRFDTGIEDEFTHIVEGCRQLSTVLTSLGIAHVYEAYNGDHRNRLWGAEGRIATEVLPFFGRCLRTE